MPVPEFLTIAEIKALFAEEIRAAGGSLSDTFDDGARLFSRSLLPQVREVRKADRLQGGVALRASGREVWVHPYVFRLVCSNGAIMAHAIQTRHVEGQDFAAPEEVAEEVRQAMRACCAEEVFTGAAEQMRSAREAAADSALNMLPMLARLPAGAGGQFLQTILDRFFQEADHSRFGLVNAVTSVARDTRSPEIRWRLEELGGAIAAGLTPVLQPDDTAAAAVVG
jgi:hypothetical protein